MDKGTHKPNTYNHQKGLVTSRERSEIRWDIFTHSVLIALLRPAKLVDVRI